MNVLPTRAPSLLPQSPFSKPRALIFSLFYTIAWCTGILLLGGCPPDHSAFQEENQRLKKQIAKQESVISSLQNGNKVTQQQIDLLNQEARETKEQYEQKLQSARTHIQQLTQGRQHHDRQLQTLQRQLQTSQAEKHKLARDAKWLRTQRQQMRKALKVQQDGGRAEAMPFLYTIVLHNTEEALSRHGYKVLASMQTDQKAVFITERKISPPASLESSGFRNQYIVTVEKTNSGTALLWVKADFEKYSQKGHLLEAGPKEMNEIETRLIQDIQQTLKKIK